MATKSASDYGRPDTLTIRTPDDFHHHFRDEPVLADTVQACSAQFRRAIAMPNLVPPVTTVVAAAAYRERILGAAASRGVAAGAFEPLMTLYLTDSTTPEQIKAAHASGIVKAVKLYPAGATTNSASGVTDYAKVAAPLDFLHSSSPMAFTGSGGRVLSTCATACLSAASTPCLMCAEWLSPKRKAARWLALARVGVMHCGTRVRMMSYGVAPASM